jgi:hypothetical protein
MQLVVDDIWSRTQLEPFWSAEHRPAGYHPAAFGIVVFADLAAAAVDWRVRHDLIVG